MTDTATPATGPVDAPASIESIIAEFEAGGEGGDDEQLEAVTEELVNEAEGESDSSAEPETEDEATEPGEVEAEAEDGTPDGQTYTVKVNGEERQVPLEELLKGYSRTEDYKAKTTAVAEERRALEQQRSTLEANLKAEYANQLEQATNLFAEYDPVLAEAQRIDWQALKQNDPAAFVQAQDAVNARLAAIQQMRGQVEQTRAQAQQLQQVEMERERAERFDRTADEIVKLMPDLADEAKFRAFAGGAVDYLRGEGFDQAEIAEALDHRVLTLADKARQWDAHVAAQKSLQQKKVVQKSAVKPLTTDGGGSRVSKPRMPDTSSRDKRAEWAVNRILEDM